MDSSLSLNWTRPLVVDEGALRAFLEVVSAFICAAKVDASASAGLAPAEATTAGHIAAIADAVDDGDRRNELMALSRSFKDIERIAFSVRLRNNITLRHMSLEEVLSLPNVGERTVTSVSLSNDSSKYSISIEWPSSAYTWSNATLRGPYNLVDRFERELRDRFAEHTSSWAALRAAGTKRALCLSVFFVASIVVFGILNQILVHYNFSKPITLTQYVISGSESILIAFFSGAFWLFEGNRLIDWLVPSVEFQFGGGGPLNRRRASIRRALFWTVPVLGIVLPLSTETLAKLLIR
jgi:hypothetical protein